MTSISEGQSTGDVFPNPLLESLKSRLAMSPEQVLICQQWQGDILSPKEEVKRY
jgi:hypothetical protein